MARRPVPADLEDALAANQTARERFWALPPDQLDRWVAYVERARFPGRRRRRIAETVRRLGGGATSDVRGGGAVALPRDDWALWLVGLALLAAAAAFLVWWFGYRDDNGNARSASVVVTAKSTVPKLTGIKLQAAEFQLKERKLESKVVRRASGGKVGTVLAQSPKPGTQIVQGSVVTLTVSKGKPGVAVPKLVGLAAADAVNQLQAKGLTAELQQAVAQAAPGTVVQQSPAPGKRAKRGSTVRLTVARGAAAVAVPDVTGRSQQDAVSTLRQAGLAARAVDVPSSQPAGTVVAQSPSAGAKVQQGSTVRLNVAASAPATTAATTAAPTTTTTQASSSGNDYSGMRLAAAAQKVAQGRQEVIVEYVSASAPAGVVVSNAREGGKVRLQVSAGAHPKQPKTVPDTTGEDGSSAQDDLTGAGFSVVSVEWPVSDASSDGVVVYQTPTGTAPQGSAVVVYVGSANG
jgi:beta-lactam-binding protein with PASTA domain